MRELTPEQIAQYREDIAKSLADAIRPENLPEGQQPITNWCFAIGALLWDAVALGMVPVLAEQIPEKSA